MKKKYFICFIFLLKSYSYAQNIKILFDATKAEMAGNADWVIDADVNNLGSNFNGAMVVGRGYDSNPQRIPTLAQINITSSENETYWTGALSNWAIDLVRQGYEVESLPYNDSITYGNNSHPQDLSHYNVFIIDEPNILFSSSQKIALINFVQNGGGLFIISDHDASDRNGDGFDSPYIWNDLFTNNTIHSNPFGITFDYMNFSQTSTNIANLPDDSCLHGIMGNATELQFSNGTSMSLDAIANNSVRGLIYKNSASNTGNTEVLFARARFGNGKVCALGDSSPPDDGTGDPNDNLFFSYTGEAHGSHQRLLVNSVIWLATNNEATGILSVKPDNFIFNIYPNPSRGNAIIQYDLVKSMNLTIECFDLSGRIVLEKEIKNFTAGVHSEEIIFPGKGYYTVRVISTEGVTTRSAVVN